MNTPNPYQLDLKYRGHDVSVMTAPSPRGWTWAVFIDDRDTIESRDAWEASSELALTSGKAAAEARIDADDASISHGVRGLQ